MTKINVLPLSVVFRVWEKVPKRDLLNSSYAADQTGPLLNVTSLDPTTGCVKRNRAPTPH